MIMGSVTDYVLVEPTNMQQALDRDHHRSLLPRFEVVKEGVRYSSTFYTFADFNGEKAENGYTVSATTGLTDNNYHVLEGVKPQVEYRLNEEGITIAANNASGVKFVLPLITGEVNCLKGTLVATDKIFFLTGGFQATEYTYVPDENGELELKIF